jgi:hypothetical protein
MPNLSITVTANSMCIPEELKEPDDYIINYNGKIYLHTEDDEELVGKVSFFKTENIFEMPWNLFDVLDTHSQEALNIYKFLQHDSLPKDCEDLHEMLDYYTHILYLKSIELLPKIRKQGIVKLVTNTIFKTYIEDITKCLVFLEAHPIEIKGDNDWSIKMNMPALENTDKLIVVEKLKNKYVNDLGFKPIGSYHMYKAVV